MLGRLVLRKVEPFGGTPLSQNVLLRRTGHFSLAWNRMFECNIRGLEVKFGVGMLQIHLGRPQPVLLVSEKDPIITCARKYAEIKEEEEEKEQNES